VPSGRPSGHLTRGSNPATLASAAQVGQPLIGALSFRETSMFLSWALELGVLLAVALLALRVIWRARAKGSTLVLRRFELRTYPQEPETPVVEIVGRSPGIIAFLLTNMQLEDQTTLTVNNSQVECRSSSLFGHMIKFIPLTRVASVTAGVRKPVEYLVLAAMLLLGGLSGSVAMDDATPVAVAILFAAACTVAYFISKKIILEISSNAGLEVSLRFKPALIEGVPVDIRKALAAVGVIRDLVVWRSRENVLQEARALTDPELAARDALAAAVQVYKAGRKDEAISQLLEVVKRYPSTRAANTARQNLQKLGTGSDHSPNSFT
jgi:hypothetical protein